MNHITQIFAATEVATDPSLFEALGIDWRLLLLQTLAFVVLVWFLGKFVYPHLIKAIDKREKAIAESVAAASEAEARAEKAQKEIDALLKDARTEAEGIVATAKKEAAVTVEGAEDKAAKRAERIINDAKAQLEQDITDARKALREETASLVATATEKIIREKVDEKRDSALIESALKEAR